MKRCSWVNLKNSLYVNYHDNEWGKPQHDEQVLFEFLVLEMFQAGLSWECVLNKRENFRRAFDNFKIEKIASYNEQKINQLLLDKTIIRNRLKLKAMIENSKIFQAIQKEWGSFDNYIWSFTNNQVVFEEFYERTTSPLSDKISKDLINRGMKFVGSTIIYAYLQAIGIINGHEKACEYYKKK